MSTAAALTVPATIAVIFKSWEDTITVATGDLVGATVFKSGKQTWYDGDKDSPVEYKHFVIATYHFRLY